MKVILKENVEKLGKKWEIVNVAGGYARNFLIPKKLAVIANKSNLKALSEWKKIDQMKREKQKRIVSEIAQKIEKLEFITERPVGENERIFGSVTTKEIADFLEDNGISIDKRNIEFETQIRSLGTFYARIKLYSDIFAKLKIIVKAEKR